MTLNQLFLLPFHFVNFAHHDKKQIILIFRTNLARKVYFWSKTRQTNITIEFSISEQVQAQSFISFRQFYLFGLNLPKKQYFQSKRENMNIRIEFTIFELTQASSFILNTQFIFLDQICPKRVFLVQNRKSHHLHRIQHTVKQGDIEQRGDIEQSYPFHGNSAMTAMSQDVCVLDCLLKVSVPQPQNL